MRRRNYLGLLSTGSISLLAGCNSQGQTTSTSTSTPTSTETPTETPPPSFSTRDLSPDSAGLGEDLQIEIEIENSGGSGTWEAEYAVSTSNGSEPEEYSTETISQHIPAGETRVWTSEVVSYEVPAVIFYQIGDGTIQTIDVPEDRSPIIDETNLVSEWNTFGDAIDNSISEVEVGELVNIASRYWYWLENQSLDIFSQVEVYNESDDRVDIKTDNSQQVVDYTGWGNWEKYVSFDSTGWDSGTYTAEILIRDEQNDEVSNAGTVEFELV